MTLFPRRKPSSMKSKHFLLWLVVIFAAIGLSACSGATLVNSWPGLTTDGETAYLAAGAHVYAVRLSDGHELWRYPAKSNNGLQFIAPPVLTPDGSLIIGSAGSDHRLFALDLSRPDPATNAPLEKWTFVDAQDRWIAGVLVEEDKVFAANTDGNVYVLDLTDGLSSKKAIAQIELGGPLWSRPVSNGELVFVTSMNHFLHAFDLHTYTSPWPPIDLGGAAPGSPLIGPDGNVYVGSFASQVLRVDPASGQATPFASTQGWVWGEAALEGESLYFGDLEGNFYAYQSDGQRTWSIQPDGPVVGSPLVMSDYVIFATESGSLYAVDRQGKIVWQRQIGGKIYTTPITNGEYILVAPMQAEFALSAHDLNGSQVWSYTPEK